MFLNKDKAALQLIDSVDFWWWKVAIPVSFETAVSINPGCSGIICTNMFYI